MLEYLNVLKLNIYVLDDDANMLKSLNMEG